MQFLRFDLGKLDNFKRTGSGALAVPAYLSRAGVLRYQNSDGSERLELRHPDVIFKKESLDSLKHVALTEGHRAVIGADNWKQHAVGFVGEDVRKDGDKIAATLYVQDADTIGKIERGDLKELSLGYTTDVEKEDGEYEGEKYTHKQLNPTYNHAAIGPGGWGRAGPEVGLRLDGYTYEFPAHKLTIMADEKSTSEKTAVTVHVDGAEVERLRGENAALTARVKDLEGQVAELPKRLDASLKLRNDAAGVLGKVPEGDDRAVMLAVITNRSKEFRADGLSDEALRSAFAFALSLPSPGLAAANVQITTPEIKNDASDAYDRMVKRHANAWKVG